MSSVVNCEHLTPGGLGSGGDGGEGGGDGGRRGEGDGDGGGEFGGAGATGGEDPHMSWSDPSDERTRMFPWTAKYCDPGVWTRAGPSTEPNETTDLPPALAFSDNTAVAPRSSNEPVVDSSICSAEAQSATPRCATSESDSRM
jgi:hypothetical protein